MEGDGRDGMSWKLKDFATSFGKGLMRTGKATLLN